jgi:hypothetical protein
MNCDFCEQFLRRLALYPLSLLLEDVQIRTQWINGKRFLQLRKGKDARMGGRPRQEGVRGEAEGGSELSGLVV